MNKKLELDMSEILLAGANGNSDRMMRILHRLSFDQKEKLARALLVSLSSTLNGVPAETMYPLLKEFGFDLITEEVA